VKVVFLEDIPGVAEVGEIKEVADGYGRNYLLPRKLAALANSAASNILEAQLKKKARLQAQTEVEMTELAQQLDGKEITLKAKAGSKERLYGSITSADIVEGISNSLGLVIDKKKVELTEVPIRLFKEILPRIMLTIVEEKAEEKKEDEDKGKAKKKSRAKKKTETETKAEAKKETGVKAEVEALPVEEKAEEKKEDEDKGKAKKKSRAKKKTETEPKAEEKTEEAKEMD